LKNDPIAVKLMTKIKKMMGLVKKAQKEGVYDLPAEKDVMAWV
jgi:hypothetical protein